MQTTTIERIDLRTLEVIVAVARHGGFAEAGRRLGLSRSIVSRTVAQLETELGIAVFRRTTRRVRLTASGRELVRRIERDLRSLRATLVSVRDENASARGPIRLTLGHAYGRHVVLPVLERWRAAHPGVTLEIALEDTLVDLVEQEYDIAIRLGPLPDSRLVARPLAPLALALVAAADAPWRPEGARAAWARAPRLAFRIPDSEREFGWLDEARDGAVGSAAVSCTSIEGVVDLVRAGVGTALVPRYLVETDLARGRLVEAPFAHGVGSVPVHLCRLERERIPTRVRALIDHLCEALGPASASGSRGS